MNMVKNIIFQDQSMMIGTMIVGRIDNFMNSKQSFEDVLEEADFEVVDPEDTTSEEDITPEAHTTHETHTPPHSFPDELNTPEAIEWLGKMQFAGWLDEHFQPVKLTVAQMGCIVVKAQYELGLNACWKDFAALWNMNKDTLRTGFLSGQDTKQTKAFNKKLNDV